MGDPKEINLKFPKDSCIGPTSVMGGQIQPTEKYKQLEREFHEMMQAEGYGDECFVGPGYPAADSILKFIQFKVAEAAATTGKPEKNHFKEQGERLDSVLRENRIGYITSMDHAILTMHVMECVEKEAKKVRRLKKVVAIADELATLLPAGHDRIRLISALHDVEELFKEG